MPSNSTSSKEPFPGSSLLTNLLPLPAPAPPTFPTFSQLVQESERQRVARETKPTGLFAELLGDPQVLLTDLLSNPDKYEDGVYSLLLPLVSGRRKLTDLAPDERQLLDHAVIDYSQARRTPREPAAPPPPPSREEPISEEIEYHEPSPFPQGEPGAYWWLK